jgi:hypothetical protein
MRLVSIALAGAAIAAFASPASAAIEVQTGGGFVQPSENVLTNTSQTANSVQGYTNQTNTSVTVTSTSDVISTTASQGQARFTPVDGSLDQGTIFLTNGSTFTQAEFNLFNALPQTTLVDIFINGAFYQQFSLNANGENYFGFNATGGDVFTSIGFNTNGTGVVDLRQVRIGGIQAAAAVPEPATWALMLLGFGGMGVAMRRNRRRNVNSLAQMA